MQTRNLNYNADGTVIMEIDHPVYGWIHFTATPNDPEQLGRDLYAQAIAGALGTIAAYVAPALTAAEFSAAVQLHLDATARTKNYDGILSAASYKASTSATFAAEATAAIAWRDAVWLYCYAELAKVQAGTRAIPPSTASFIAELPVISW